jgi:hypothetical protein
MVKMQVNYATRLETERDSLADLRQWLSVQDQSTFAHLQEFQDNSVQAASEQQQAYVAYLTKKMNEEKELFKEKITIAEYAQS